MEALSGMRNLKNPDLILEKCVEINRLENEADVQLRRSDRQAIQGGEGHIRH